MRLRKVLTCLMFTATLASASGCGSGGNTTGSLTLAVTPTTAGMKSVIQAVATYSSPAGTGQGLEINFSTNHPEIFAGGSAHVTTAGTATFLLSPILNAATAPTGPKTITVVASSGDLQQTATFVLKPATMQISQPATTSFSAGSIAVGGVLRVVPSGMFVKITDGLGNPVPQGTSVTMSVKNIVNGTIGDVLFWNDFPGGPAIAISNALTQLTDATGQVPMNITMDIVVPSTKSNTEVINWQITFTDPDTGASIVGYASTSLSVTP